MNHLSYKFRLKPTKDQEKMLQLNIDACRFVYNKLLEYQIELNAAGKNFLFGFAPSYELPRLKEVYPFLKDAIAQALVKSSLNLGKAFSNRFSKTRKVQTGFPKFKSSKNNRQTFHVEQGFKIKGNKIKLPKIGFVKVINHRKISGLAKHITIIKDVDGWYASILCEQTELETTIDQSNVVGIDLGIKTFAVTSDGECFDLPDVKKETKKLKKLQRRHAKKAKGSKNRDKARIKLAKQHKKIHRIKKNAVDNIASSINKSYDVVAMEDLNIQGMKKNKRLSSQIHQNPWGMLKSKIQETAKEFHLVNRWFPSSKTCSACGTINHNLTLADRRWVCESCGTDHDRDVNAAINLRNCYTRTDATSGLVCGEPSNGDLGLPESSYGSLKQKKDLRSFESVETRNALVLD